MWFRLESKKLPVDWDFGDNYATCNPKRRRGCVYESDTRGGGTNFNGHKFSVFFHDR